MAKDEEEKTPGRLKSKWLDEEDKPKQKLPWLNNPNKTRMKKSIKQETRIAKELGGRRLPRSGGTRWSKNERTTDDGDVSTPEFHVEHKRTEKKSISLKREWLEKVREGSRKFAKDPAVVITFQDPAKPYNKPEDWILIPLETAKRILGYEDDDE